MIKGGLDVSSAARSRKENGLADVNGSSNSNAREFVTMEVKSRIGTNGRQTSSQEGGRVGRKPSLRLAERQSKRDTMNGMHEAAQRISSESAGPDDSKRKRVDTKCVNDNDTSENDTSARKFARTDGGRHAATGVGNYNKQGVPGGGSAPDKYCHFCQHAKKNMLPCESEGCTHIYCLYCLSVHLGDDTDPSTSSAWLRGSWRCPTCRQGCCCSKVMCTRGHRHCKAFRYRCRRADAASKRNTAAHALVCLFSSNSSDKGLPSADKEGDERSSSGSSSGGGGRSFATSRKPSRSFAATPNSRRSPAIAAQPVPNVSISEWSDGLNNLIAAGQSQSLGAALPFTVHAVKATPEVTAASNGVERLQGDAGRSGWRCEECEPPSRGSREQEGVKGEEEVPVIAPTSSEGAALQALASLFSTSPPPRAPTSETGDEEGDVTEGEMVDVGDNAPPAGAEENGVSAEVEPV